MLICCLCPLCQAEHELSEKLIGDTIACPKCGQPFTVKESERKEERIGLHTAFNDNRRPQDGESTTSSPKDKSHIRNGKHSLILPPPPKEHWSNKKDKDEPAERFPEFRHKSRAVREFLERDDVSDYSWLLVAGLIASTMLVLTFLAFFIYLLVR
jgi:hypothetical protein